MHSLQAAGRRADGLGMTALLPVITSPRVPAAELRDLDGTERFAGLDAGVADFWRFAMGDLRSNTTRGLLAEFLVQQAVGGTGVREEWAGHDVMAPDGTRIEVKSSARLQAWPQRQTSPPTFRGLRSRTWTEGRGRATTATHHADVYVFCLHVETDLAAFDPLDLEQWRFAVLGRRRVEVQGRASLGWASVLRLTGHPLHHRELAAAVASCRDT